MRIGEVRLHQRLRDGVPANYLNSGVEPLDNGLDANADGVEHRPDGDALGQRGVLEREVSGEAGSTFISRSGGSKTSRASSFLGASTDAAQPPASGCTKSNTLS